MICLVSCGTNTGAWPWRTGLQQRRMLQVKFEVLWYHPSHNERPAWGTRPFLSLPWKKPFKIKIRTTTISNPIRQLQIHRFVSSLYLFLLLNLFNINMHKYSNTPNKIIQNYNNNNNKNNKENLKSQKKYSTPQKKLLKIQKNTTKPIKK